MEENREVRYQIIPKFNLLYELGMPTGKKIRNSLVILILFLVLTLIISFKAPSLSFANYEIMNNIKIDKILIIICIIAIVITIIKLICTIIFQKLQYNHVTYTFYDHMMVYEDDFLNQHRKNIEYKNIKEVEIRRTIWDRILNYGIMVIYTNADNDRNNGLVIYSIKDPKSHYDVIDKLIHNRDNLVNDNKSVYTNNITQTTQTHNNDNNYNNDKQNSQMSSKNDVIDNQSNNISTTSVNNVDNPEQDFKDSLKNINE